LYLAIDTMPIRFPVASAVGWFLVLTAGLALAVQARALKGRSYAVLSGRTRPVVPQRLSRVEQAVAVSIVFVFFLLALGVPAIGAISASLLNNFGHFTWASVTLDNYHRAVTDAQLVDPLLLSGRMAAITALGAVVLGVLIARMLARGTIGLAAQLMDWVLVGSVALPSIVLAAGYIFAYNLPVLSDIGINLYGTILLLGAAYLASSLPATSRLLLGPLAQVQRSLLDAARVHGAGEAYAVMTTLVPLLARAMVWAGLLTFGGVLLELPISQMLYPAGQEPLSVAITKQLQNYDFAGGSAEMIVAAAGTLVVVGLVLGAFRLLTPRGWQRPAGARR
jgi:iron(III) transport system permease protein